MPEGPAQLVAWIASQPTDYSGNVVKQTEMLAQLRAQGVVRTKIDPQ